MTFNYSSLPPSVTFRRAVPTVRCERCLAFTWTQHKRNQSFISFSRTALLHLHRRVHFYRDVTFKSYSPEVPLTEKGKVSSFYCPYIPHLPNNQRIKNCQLDARTPHLHTAKIGLNKAAM